ncbi:MAG: hypothetical protein JXR25_04125 [Pontiellaceae bacterium]|nr:hypothetical protein [Pontiellaceae bacterium]MBN2783990.1 hypothetical protein [Pontiellaceae bacterium]
MIIKLGAAILHVFDNVFQTEFYARLIQLRLHFHTPCYRFNKNEVALVHVPKTAGTTLYTMLEMDPLHRFKNINRHRPVSQYCMPGEYQYITVMRNPVDRVWSHYHMILRTPHGRFRHAAEKGIENYLKECWMGRNMACRYYAGDVREEPNDQTLALARKNLSRFLRILSFDHIEEDLTQFLRESDIPVTEIPHKRKVSYTQPSQEEREIIASYNSYDLILFNDFETARKENP